MSMVSDIPSVNNPMSPGITNKISSDPYDDVDGEVEMQTHDNRSAPRSKEGYIKQQGKIIKKLKDQYFVLERGQIEGIVIILNFVLKHLFFF